MRRGPLRSTEDRVMVCHDSGYYNLIDDPDVKSADTNKVRPMVDGRLPYFFGFDLKSVADRNEGGLKKSSNDRTNYAWQKQSIGLAMNIAPKIEINYDPAYGAHRVTGFISLGAVVIQREGVAKITTHEA